MGTWVSKDELNEYYTEYGCFGFKGYYLGKAIGEYKYEWEVTRMGVTNYYDSTITLTPNQYFEFNLNY